MHNDWVDLSRYDIAKLSQEFQAATPFNHIYIDNFFNEVKLDNVLGELRQENYETWDKRDHQGIQVKWRSNWRRDEDVPSTTYSLVQFLNSGNFLRWLTQLTGIQGIIPDPYLSGGGFNQTNRGGLLEIHADGNWHDTMGVHRRLNVVVYLNKEWDDSWGGQLEFWSKSSSNRPHQLAKRISPLFNRICIFRTDDFSYHGHPHPLDCPADRSRQSLILYYYTNTRPDNELVDPTAYHRAIFYKTQQK